MKPYVMIPAIALLFVSCTKEETASTDTTAPAEVVTDAKPYPLKTCLVSGEELGSMGDAIVINHEGQEIKLCCDKCVPKFKEDPEKYMAELKEKSAE